MKPTAGAQTSQDAPTILADILKCGLPICHEWVVKCKKEVSPISSSPRAFHQQVRARVAPIGAPSSTSRPKIVRQGQHRAGRCDKGGRGGGARSGAGRCMEGQRAKRKGQDWEIEGL